jgi:hypothetical protein
MQVHGRGVWGMVKTWVCLQVNRQNQNMGDMREKDEGKHI